MLIDTDNPKKYVEQTKQEMSWGFTGIIICDLSIMEFW